MELTTPFEAGLSPARHVPLILALKLNKSILMRYSSNAEYQVTVRLRLIVSVPVAQVHVPRVVLDVRSHRCRPKI